MAVSAEDIKNFVMANLDNPSAIAQAAQQYGISSDAIASAVGVPVSTVTSYFADAGVTAPTPAAVTPTPIPTPTLTPTPTPTPTPPPVAPTAPTAPSALATSQPLVYNIPGITDQQISVLKQYSPQMWTALQTGRAKVKQVNGKTQIVDSTTGVPFDTSGLEISVLPNNQLSIVGYGGKAQQVGVTTSIDPSGNVAPLTDQSISRVNQYNVDNGGVTFAQLIQVGLAFALPVVGEAIAAAMTTSLGVVVPTAVGTAMAAVGVGVAQGKTIEQSVKEAAPTLIAAGIMDQVGMDNLGKQITDNKQYQNVINNVATSTVKTAIAGGDAKDIFNNAVSTGAGTIFGDSVNSQAAGQTIASTLGTGSTISGLSAGAGVLGQNQATANAIERIVGPIMDAPASKIDSQTQAIINQLGAGSQDPGILTAANAPPNLNAVSASALPAMLGTANEKSGPIQVQTDPDGSVSYTRTISGIDANGKPYQYIAIYDPLETTPNRQVSYSIPGTIGTSETVAPSVSGTASAYTRPIFDTSAEGEGASTKSTPDINVSVGGIGKKDGVSGGLGIGDGITKPGLIDSGGTKGGTGNVAGTGGGSTLGTVGIGGGVGTTGLGGTTGTGTGASGTGTAISGSGITGTGVGGGGGTGTGTGIGIGTGTGTGTTPQPIPSKPEIPSTPPTEEPPPTTEEPTFVSVGTSTVKPKIKASYPTIQGQFASPLTQAVSAYRPPGDIESMGTGKEREDVWNTESLRNALGI